MEKIGEWEQRSLINELKQGRELARQLQLHLNLPSSSHETREILVQKIQSSYEKVLSMLNYSTSSSAADLSAADPSAAQPSGLAIRMLESSPSLSESPQSEDSDRDFKDQESKDPSKKSSFYAHRKTLPRWTQQVRVMPGTSLEGTLDDGFSWRKYGQKDILGAKYPRGYYRCTHRNVLGCLATKQVQRSDDDPTVLEITYRGRHTCTLAVSSSSSSAAHVMAPSGSGALEKQEQGTCMDQVMKNQLPEQNQKQSQDLLLNFQRGLKVITEDLDIRHDHQQIYPSFPYPSSPTTSSVMRVENNVFSPCVMDNNHGMGNLSSSSPSFKSPATSGTNNYFSMSPRGRSRMNSGLQEPTSEGQLSEIIQAAATSTTNSPTVGMDFPFGNPEFNPNFSFDNHGFFP